MDTDWTDKSPACVGRTDVFFGPEFEPKHARAEREATAKAICAGCAARDDCLTVAMRNRERSGVWGGLNPEERRELARALRAG